MDFFPSCTLCIIQFLCKISYSLHGRHFARVDVTHVFVCLLHRQWVELIAFISESLVTSSVKFYFLTFCFEIVLGL